MDREAVTRWLDRLVQALRAEFGERLLYVGHHGSWARGEARPDSDIDTAAVLDHVGPSDLVSYRGIVESMPEAAKVASGALLSAEELGQWPGGERLQFFYGCKVLHGSMDGVVTAPSTEEIVEGVRVIASTNLFAGRHYLLCPHNLPKVVHNLRYPFKHCFFALQAWMLVETGHYFDRKEDLLVALQGPLDREVVEVARDWHKSENDRTQRPLHYIELLERWGTAMLARLP